MCMCIYYIDISTILSHDQVGALFTADGLPRPSLVGYAPLCALIVGRLIILPACHLANGWETHEVVMVNDG